MVVFYSVNICQLNGEMILFADICRHFIYKRKHQQHYGVYKGINIEGERGMSWSIKYKTCGEIVMTHVAYQVAQRCRIHYPYIDTREKRAFLYGLQLLYKEYDD